MNNFTLDSYSVSIDNFEGFIKAVNDYESNVSWRERETKALTFEAIPHFPLTFEQDAANLGISDMEAFEDTANDTGFGLVVNDGYENHLLRAGAFRSICDRLHISGSTLSKLDRKDLATVFSICAKVVKGKSLIRHDGHKVCAIQGADSGEYAILHSPTIFESVNRILDTDYNGSTFVTGSLTHDFLLGKWDMSAYSGVLLQKAASCGLNTGGFTPSLLVGTSDTGYSSVVITPVLQRHGNGIVPILGGIKVKHKNRANMQKVEEAVNMVLTSFDENVASLAELSNIKIENGRNAILAIGKHIALPRKAVYEAAEVFAALNPSDYTTAFEVYLSLCEAASLANAADNSPLKVCRINDNLGKALKCRWRDYDIVGEYNW